MRKRTVKRVVIGGGVAFVAITTIGAFTEHHPEPPVDHYKASAIPATCQVVKGKVAPGQTTLAQVAAANGTTVPSLQAANPSLLGTSSTSVSHSVSVKNTTGKNPSTSTTTTNGTSTSSRPAPALHAGQQLSIPTGNCTPAQAAHIISIRAPHTSGAVNGGIWLGAIALIASPFLAFWLFPKMMRNPIGRGVLMTALLVLRVLLPRRLRMATRPMRY